MNEWLYPLYNIHVPCQKQIRQFVKENQVRQTIKYAATVTVVIVVNKIIY